MKLIYQYVGYVCYIYCIIAARIHDILKNNNYNP